MFNFLSQKFTNLFSSLSGTGKLTEKNMQETLEKIRSALLEADVPLNLVDSFVADVQQKALGARVLQSLKADQQLIKIVHDQLKLFLGGQHATAFAFQLPSVVMVMGLQGSGKTTTIAKLAHYVQEQAKARGKSRRILLASVDFYRPAAVDQLEILATTAGVSFYRATSTDPVKAAQECLEQYKKGLYELLFLDTAGRLHVDDALLQELSTIDSQLSPRYKLLVLDSMTGQESLRVAQSFESRVGFVGAILTKMDSETRGGAAFSFRYALKKPVLFVGTGEKLADLELFYPDRMADRILGMGDVLSLVEKIDQQVKKEEQEAAIKAFEKGRMTLQDFADQLAMISNIGPLSQLMKYLPGAVGAQLSAQDLEESERTMKRARAIISAMTRKERQIPTLLDASRKQRIAKGAGVGVADVNQLLQRFEQSQQYAKLLKKFGRGNTLFK